MHNREQGRETRKWKEKESPWLVRLGAVAGRYETTHHHYGTAPDQTAPLRYATLLDPAFASQDVTSRYEAFARPDQTARCLRSTLRNFAFAAQDVTQLCLCITEHYQTPHSRC